MQRAACWEVMLPNQASPAMRRRTVNVNEKERYCRTCVQLARNVAENILAIDSKFWLRIAARSDTAASKLCCLLCRMDYQMTTKLHDCIGCVRSVDREGLLLGFHRSC
jgi:hypothetical protein